MIEKLIQSDLNNYWSPFHWVSDPRLFAGRRNEILDIVRFLRVPTTLLAISGLRGVGKTSIMHQMGSIGLGDEFLIKSKLDPYTQHEPRGGFRAICLYRKCMHDIRSVEELFGSILFDSVMVIGQVDYSDRNSVPTKLMEKMYRYQDVPVSMHELANTNDEVLSKTQYRKLSHSYISRLLLKYSDMIRQRYEAEQIVLMFDEYETLILRQLHGMGDIIRDIGSHKLKIVISGVASSYDELMKQHSSLKRDSKTIDLGLMTEIEISEIFKKAESLSNGLIEMTEGAKEELVKVANKFPYFIQRLGFHSCDIALQEENRLRNHISDKLLVQKCQANKAIKMFYRGEFNTGYDKMYEDIVAADADNEATLKCLIDALQEKTRKGRGITLKNLIAKVNKEADTHKKRSIASNIFTLLSERQILRVNTNTQMVKIHDPAAFYFFFNRHPIFK